MSARTDSRSKGEAGNPSSDISTANCSRRRLVVGGSPRAALCEYLTTESGGRGGGRVRGRGGTFFLHRWKANGGGCKSCGSSCVRACSNYLFSIWPQSYCEKGQLTRGRPCGRLRSPRTGLGALVGRSCCEKQKHLLASSISQGHGNVHSHSGLCVGHCSDTTLRPLWTTPWPGELEGRP